MTVPNIVVIGDLILDHYLIGEASRLSPEAPIPVVKAIDEVYILGGACNVVRNLELLGANVTVFGVIGEDNNGTILLQLLREINININNILQIKERPTTFKSRVKVGNHQIVRIDKECDSFISENQEMEIMRRFKKVLKQIDLVILSDYAKGVLTFSLLQGIIKLCHGNGIRVLVDPKGRDFNKYEGCYLSTPNKLEASLATGVEIEDENSLKLAMKILKETLNTQHQIITMGADGIAYSNYETLKIFPAKASEVYDVTGAGDTVIAALGFNIAKGQSIEESIEFANTAASIVVQKRGSATASLDEIASLTTALNSHIEVISSIDESLILKIEEFSNVIIECFRRGNKILICGNGGSAGDAQHISAELVGRFVKERIPLPSIALTTDTSALTAIGNDYSFQDIFKRQIEAIANEGDIVLGISTSGKSKNVLMAFEGGKNKSCINLGLSGNGGGDFDSICEYNIVVPSNVTARIQEAHILIGHIICELIDENY